MKDSDVEDRVGKRMGKSVRSVLNAEFRAKRSSEGGGVWRLATRDLRNF